MHLIQRLRVLFAATKSNMAEQHTDVPNELATGWAESLDLDTLDYLYAESRARLLEDLDFARSQELKIRVVAGLAVFAIGATGLLGRLRFDFSGEPVLTALTLTALLTFAATLLITAWMTWPGAIRTGVDLTWLARYAQSGARSTDLRASTVEAQVTAYTENRAGRAGHRLLLRITMMLTAINIASVLSIHALATGANGC